MFFHTEKHTLSSKHWVIFRMLNCPFLTLISIQTATHGRRWPRLRCRSIPIPWIPVSLVWMFWTEVWTLRDGYTAPDCSAQSGGSLLWPSRWVKRIREMIDVFCSDWVMLSCFSLYHFRIVLFFLFYCFLQMFGVTRTCTYVQEHSVVDPKQQTFELQSTNVSRIDKYFYYASSIQTWKPNCYGRM